MTFLVEKADGTTEYFKVEKLRRSLRRAGASVEEITTIIARIEHQLYNGMRTQEIYRIAFDLLRDIGATAATRYALRRALLGLGPTGFPFERFLARLFEASGYTTDTGITLQGHCAPHEIDIAAYKDNHAFVGEAKFHARPGIKTDLQVAMYSYARLLDLRDQKICQGDICGVKEFWLITNTKFTITAEKYSECVGIKLLSWDYPRKDNLHDRIQRAHIYPITVLQTLNRQQIARLIERDVIVTNDIIQKPHMLRGLNLSQERQTAVLNEVTSLTRHHTSAQ
ncbi:MAG: hypothetical protein RLZZ360_31 [Candidatus Parcubacteria bacterium]